MARIVHTDIARLDLAGANRHEIATLRVLQTRLPDDYTVFDGVHWTREWASETIFGELDFAVINRAGKALLVEQKNEVLEDTEDDLIAHSADRSKSVVRASGATGARQCPRQIQADPGRRPGDRARLPDPSCTHLKDAIAVTHRSVASART